MYLIVDSVQGGSLFVQQLTEQEAFYMLVGARP